MVAFSILVGYYLAGVLDRMGLSRGRKKNSYEMVQHASSQEVEDDSDKEYENTSSVSLPYGDMKMVLVIRTDLDMTKGKVAAQCCHACLAAYRHSQKDKLRIWGSAGQAKITLKCNSEEELLSLHRDATKNGLVARYIQDAGRTQIDPGTITVLAIGPDYVEMINSVTGHLKLY
ncbi:hypothetical protein MP638_000576 [Amoeboaphelidium occidentale]|nr:hypothetical protein MP638_000576 [Amoeboaphelidium occidentale]